MFRKIITTSVFAIGLATAAMAQSNGGTAGDSGNDPAATVSDPQTMTPDTTTPGAMAPDSGMTTNSTTGTPGLQGSDENCPSGPQGGQADAAGNNAQGMNTANVNDNNCGK